MSPKVRIVSWGQALAHCRAQKGCSHADVVRTVAGGVNRHKVREWEDGTAIPNSYQLKGLYAMMPMLRHFTHLLPGEVKAALVAKATVELTQGRTMIGRTPQSIESALEAGDSASRITEINRTLDGVPAPWVPPRSRNGETPPAEIVDPPASTTFGGALRRARLLKGWTQDELGEQLDVGGNTISRWETESNRPVEVNWQRLIAVLPDIEDVPPPGDLRGGEKPTGNLTGGGRKLHAKPLMEAWRQKLRAKIDEIARADTDNLLGGLVDHLLDLVEKVATTPEALAALLDQVEGMVRSMKRQLPIHVVEHDRSRPGEAPPQPPVIAPPAPAPVAPPAPEVVIPDLPGVPGLSVRYGIAMQAQAQAEQHAAVAKAIADQARVDADFAALVAKEAHDNLMAAIAPPPAAPAAT